MTRADFPAGISYLIADFADTNLQTASFELVLINGWATAFSDPGAVLAEAVRLRRKPGYILYIPSADSGQNMAFEQAFAADGSYLQAESQGQRYLYSCIWD